MLTPWEIKQKEMVPPLHMIKLNISGVFFLMKIILMNLGTFKMMKNQKKFIYKRPTPPYTIPKYKPDMKSTNSEEKYLRPTLFCNCRKPEIIALAHQLGAYQKSDREFAEAAFEFTKRKITLEIRPLEDDVDEVVFRGTGTCIHKISVFIALCRAAGIPARYKFFSLTMLDTWMGTSLENAPLMKKWYNAMGAFMMHGEGEVYLEGKWVTADVGAEPQRQAASWMPVTKLGEDSAGLWLFPIPGTTFIRESIPLGLGIPSQILMKWLVPSSVVGINVGILEQIEKGKKIIEETGGEAAYDSEARKKRKQATPKTDLLQKPDNIIFEEK